MLIWFLPVFLVFLMIGLPVFFGLLAAPGILLFLSASAEGAADPTKELTLLYRNVYNGMDSFPLMAIPFFMLAGELMNKGGITMLGCAPQTQTTYARGTLCPGPCRIIWGQPRKNCKRIPYNSIEIVKL